jgi:hypothetical protein
MNNTDDEVDVDAIIADKNKRFCNAAERKKLYGSKKP